MAGFFPIIITLLTKLKLMKKFKLVIATFLLLSFASCKKQEKVIPINNSVSNKNTLSLQENKISIPYGNSSTCGVYIDPADTLSLQLKLNDYLQCETSSPKWWPDFSNVHFPDPMPAVPIFNIYVIQPVPNDAVAKALVNKFISNSINPEEGGPSIIVQPLTNTEQQFLDVYFDERLAKILMLRLDHPNNGMLEPEDVLLLDMYSTFQTVLNSPFNLYSPALNDFFGIAINGWGNSRDAYGAIPFSTYSAGYPMMDAVRNRMNQLNNLFHSSLPRFYYYAYASENYMDELLIP